MAVLRARSYIASAYEALAKLPDIQPDFIPHWAAAVLWRLRAPQIPVSGDACREIAACLTSLGVSAQVIHVTLTIRDHSGEPVASRGADPTSGSHCVIHLPRISRFIDPVAPFVAVDFEDPHAVPFAQGQTMDGLITPVMLYKPTHLLEYQPSTLAAQHAHRHEISDPRNVRRGLILAAEVLYAIRSQGLEGRVGDYVRIRQMLDLIGSADILRIGNILPVFRASDGSEFSIEDLVGKVSGRSG
ncbi:hypothetical protein AB0P21_38415 [Kribbella sp. NPDC056861]|uniref:hypothetical protein n=1 Tax=Kribbella sp. NPDC056861 TaxID=3154857 RepID=UPI0034183E5D